MKVLSAFSHKNSFQDSDLIFPLIFKNVDLQHQFQNGHFRALLTGEQFLVMLRHFFPWDPGPAWKQSTRISGWWGSGLGGHPISEGAGRTWGCINDGSRPHPDTQNQPPGVGQVFKQLVAGLPSLPTGPCPGLAVTGPSGSLSLCTGPPPHHQVQLRRSQDLSHFCLSLQPGTSSQRLDTSQKGLIQV